MITIPRFAVLASSLFVAQAFAGTDTDTFQVTANVVGSCVITDTQDIAFGAYDPAVAHASTELDAEGSVTVRCVRGTSVVMTLNQGLSPEAGSTCGSPLRQMAGGTDNLRYDLYQDAGRNEPWGCDPANSVTFTALSPDVANTLTTYGRIPANQDVIAGSYADTVTVAVTF